MGSACCFFGTSLGKKVLMAVTGVFLVLFNVAHVLGNLQIFAGREALNGYSKALQSMPVLLWIARIGLIAIFVVHLLVAFHLKRLNLQSRPVSYADFGTVQASLASRTMLLSGALVLLYLVGHLLHFTVGVLMPENFGLLDEKGRRDVYSMVILGFQHRGVSFLYIAAMLALFSHLRHGIASMFQTLGLNHPVLTPAINGAGPLFAALIVLGYISIPVGVLTGVLQLPPGLVRP